MRMPRSILRRLTIWYGCSAFVLILISTIALYRALVTNLDREDQEFAADIVDIVRGHLRERPLDLRGLQQTIDREWSGRRYAQIFVRVLDPRGHLMVETAGMPATLSSAVFPTPVRADQSPGPGVEIAPAEGGRFIAISALAGGIGVTDHESGVIQVALGQQHEEALLAEYRRWLWWVLSLALLVCSVVGYGIAKRGVRPLAAITETAGHVRSSTLDRRIQTADLPTEIASLAETFNTMLSGLEDSFARLSRFSADIAHELRTPVNNLRGEAEVALRQDRTTDEYRSTLESLLEESVRLSRMIDSLLFVARAESPETQISREPLDIARELHLVREFYEVLAADAGIVLTVEAADDLAANLDRTLWQRAIGNLIENAVDHTPPGGHATVKASRDGDTLCVRVSDTGCGIPPEHVAHVFDRFYRVEPSRSTRSGRLGLGLALVKSIVALHGGSVEIASEAGRGTLVTLRLPLNPPALRTDDNLVIFQDDDPVISA